MEFFASEMMGDPSNEDAYPDPWWIEIQNKKDRIATEETANRMCAKRLFERVTDLMKEASYLRTQISKYDTYYNINRQKYGDIVDKMQQSSYNVIRSNCNTAQSKLGKEMPKISFLTDNARGGIQLEAKKLDQYIESEFERSELYPNVRRAVLDACIGRLGTVKVVFDKRNKRFRVSRVRPLDFIVDDKNQMYEEKAETFEQKMVGVHFLKKMFNLKEWQMEAIKKNAVDNKVACYEAYYKDTCKVYFTEGTILAILPWSGKPPYFHWRWTQSTDSFWGVGIADELYSIQVKINDILLKISRSMDLFAVPRVIINSHDDITGVKITDELGSVVKMAASGPDGTSKIDFLTPPVLNEQYFQHLEDLVMKSYQITGISQLASSGVKPKGLSSGKALLAYHDIQTDRFAQASQSLVDMYVNIARYMADIASKRFKKGAGELLPYTIDWKKLDIKNNIYQIKEYPTNLLSKSPAGRLEDVQMLINMGVIPPEKGVQLLDFPDVSKAIDMLTATDQAVEKVLERVMGGEKNVAPDPNLPMSRQIETAQKFYARAFVKDADDSVLREIEHFISLARDAVLSEVEEQQMAQGAANVAAQQGMDVQAPAGPLAPQAPGNMPQAPQGPQAQMPINQGGMR